MFVHRKEDLDLGLSTSGREWRMEGRKKEKRSRRKEKGTKRKNEKEIRRFHLERSGAAAR